jgi:hypothetical protein
MIALIILVVALVLLAVVAHAAFNRGYALGERHGRETEREVQAQWRHVSPPLTVEELDRLRLAVFGVNGTRAQAMELL